MASAPGRSPQRLRRRTPRALALPGQLDRQPYSRRRRHLGLVANPHQRRLRLAVADQSGVGRQLSDVRRWRRLFRERRCRGAGALLREHASWRVWRGRYLRQRADGGRFVRARDAGAGTLQSASRPPTHGPLRRVGDHLLLESSRHTRSRRSLGVDASDGVRRLVGAGEPRPHREQPLERGPILFVLRRARPVHDVRSSWWLWVRRSLRHDTGASRRSLRPDAGWARLTSRPADEAPPASPGCRGPSLPVCGPRRCRAQ